MMPDERQRLDGMAEDLLQVIQARAALEAAKTNQALARATWYLVGGTVAVALATIAVAVLSAA